MASDERQEHAVKNAAAGELFRSSQTLFYVAIFLILCVVPLVWSAIEQQGKESFSWVAFLQTAGKSWVLVVPVAAVLRAVQLALRDLRYDIRGIRAKNWKNHTVVCGLGDCGMHVVQNAIKRGHRVVAIERAADGPHAVSGRREGIAVVTGDAKGLPVLSFAGVAGASTVVICTGDDAENLDIAFRLETLLSGRKLRRESRLNILVELRNDWLYSHLVDEVAPLGWPVADLRVFNTYETASRLLLREITKPLGMGGERRALVLVGCGSMGRQLLMDAIRLDMTQPGERARIVIFDREAEQRRQAILAQFPVIPQFADVEFVAAGLGTETPEAWATVEQRLEAEKILAGVICLPDDNQSLYAALGLSRRLERLGHAKVPVYMRLQRHNQLGRFVVGLKHRRGTASHLHTFGSLEELFDPNNIMEAELDKFARAIHDYYREHSSASAGREMHAAWDELPEAYRQSSRRHADQLPVKLAHAGLRMAKAYPPGQFTLTPDEIETLARLEHHRWYIERSLAGWRYGPSRNEVDRANPLLVDWTALPSDAQEACREQAKALPELLAGMGFELQRTHTGAA